MIKRKISKLLIAVLLVGQMTSGIGYADVLPDADSPLVGEERTVGEDQQPTGESPSEEPESTTEDPGNGSSGLQPDTEMTTETDNEAETTEASEADTGVQPTETTEEPTEAVSLEESVQIETLDRTRFADASVKSSEEELKALGAEAVDQFFVVNYTDGTREIRKIDKSISNEIQASGVTPLGIKGLVQAYELKPEVEDANPVVYYDVTDSDVSYVPNDPEYLDGNLGLWGVHKTNTDKVYGRLSEKSLNDVVVAVIDTGIDYFHPDLDDALYIKNGKLVGHDFWSYDDDPYDGHGHGTHVSGTIAAEANNAEGIVGVAAGVRIMPVKVLSDSGGGFDFDIADGIVWATDNGADIINMSLGGPQFSQTIQDAVDYAYSKGVTVIASSGNNARNDLGSPNPVGFPAAGSHVIAVGAVELGSDDKCYITYFSNSGPELDVVAPGMNILSTVPGGQYEAWAGTSMAAPHVSALAALLKAQNHSRTPDQIETLIESKANKDFSHDKIYGQNKNIYGEGLIDSFAALGLKAGSPNTLLKDIIVEGHEIDFAPSTYYYVVNENDNTVNVKAVGAQIGQSAWISVDGTEFISMDLDADYTVTLAEGINRITIRSFGEDNKTYTDYTIEVRNGYSSNALMSMILDKCVISPEFSSEQLEYWGIASGANTSLTVSAAYANARISINGGDWQGGSATFTWSGFCDRIVIEVKDLAGVIREYILNLIPESNRLSGIYKSAGWEQLDLKTAPVLYLPEKSAGDFGLSGPQEFKLRLVNATWSASAEADLNKYDQRLGNGISRNTTFTKVDDTTMKVIINGYFNTGNLKDCIKVPLYTVLQDVDAQVSVLGMDSAVTDGTYTYADVNYVPGETVTVKSKVKIGSDGVAKLDDILIREDSVYSIVDGRKIALEIITPGFTFITKDDVAGSVVYSGGFAGEEQLLGDGDKLELIVANHTSMQRGAIALKGISIKGTPGAVVAKLEVKVSGHALIGEHVVDVASYSKPQPSTGGGGGGGAGGAEATVKVNETTTLNLEEFTLTIDPNTVSTEVGVVINKVGYSQNPFGTGVRPVSKVYNVTCNSDVKLEKPMHFQFLLQKKSYDPAKETLAVWVLNGKTNKWSEVRDVEIDGTKILLKGDTKDFTEYAVVAVPLAQIAEEVVAQGPAPVTLTDVKGHWAEAAIQKLMGKGAISGNPDGTFLPEKQITRAEFITILVKTLGLKGTTEKQFADLNGHWASDSVKAAVAAGILNGFEDGTIRPDAPITREQMAVMVAKAMKLTGGIPEKLPADEDQISAWAKDGVLSTMKAGIIGGYPDNTFRPAALATKAEAVAIIARCIQ